MRHITKELAFWLFLAALPLSGIAGKLDAVAKPANQPFSQVRLAQLSEPAIKPETSGITNSDVAKLLAQLNSKDLKVKTNAYTKLRDLGSAASSAVEVIKSSGLTDKNPDVRFAASACLPAIIGVSEAVKYYTSVLQNKSFSEDFQQAACWGLNNCGKDGFISLSEHGLTSQYGGVRRSAIASISRLHFRSGVDISSAKGNITKLLTDGDPETVKMAKRCLAAIGENKQPAADRLKQAKQLFDQGLITKEDYDKKVKEIMDAL